MSPRDSFFADRWRFLRGDGPGAEFEQWIYAHSDELEARLGKQPALEVLASDFRSSQAVAGVKQLLRDHAERESRLDCRCMRQKSPDVLSRGRPVANGIGQQLEVLMLGFSGMFRPDRDGLWII